MRKGDEFVTVGAGHDGHHIEVLRVSRDQEWADIRVTAGVAQWTERQPLVDGWFAYPVESLA